MRRPPDRIREEEDIVFFIVATVRRLAPDNTRLAINLECAIREKFGGRKIYIRKLPEHDGRRRPRE